MGLEKVKTYVRTSLLSLPLGVILNFSPLPPLTTLVYLSQLKIYEEIPEKLLDVEELRERGYSPEFLQLYEEAARAQRTGTRAGLTHYLERRIRELKTSLEMMDYNISTMIEILALITIVLPLILAAVIAFIYPYFMVGVVSGVSALGLLTSLGISLTFIPPELWLRKPRAIVFAPFLLSLPVFYVTGDVALSIMVGAIPSAVLSFREERRNYRVLEEAMNMVSKATYSRNPVLAGVDLDYLLSDVWYGIAKSAVTTLYILYTQGGRKFAEGVSKLLAFIRDYVESYRSLRRKALQSLVYALIMSSIAAVCMAIVVFTVDFMSDVGMPTGVSGFVIPTKEHVEELKGATSLYIAVTSLTYALGIASLRDGNPLYFPVYLALILPLNYVSYMLALQYAPVLVRWRG